MEILGRAEQVIESKYSAKIKSSITLIMSDITRVRESHELYSQFLSVDTFPLTSLSKSCENIWKPLGD